MRSTAHIESHKIIGIETNVNKQSFQILAANCSKSITSSWALAAFQAPRIEDSNFISPHYAILSTSIFLRSLPFIWCACSATLFFDLQTSNVSMAGSSRLFANIKYLVKHLQEITKVWKATCCFVLTLFRHFASTLHKINTILIYFAQWNSHWISSELTKQGTKTSQV